MTPYILVVGRVYFSTAEDLGCLGVKKCWERELRRHQAL